MNNQNKKWICNVCGYIHIGENPPDICTICGANKEAFNPLIEEANSIKQIITEWKCINCDYIHKGDSPPKFCPICSASSDRFEGINNNSLETITNKEHFKIVIIGAGISGLSAAESARKHAPNAEITLISKENYLPYYRLNLTRYLAKEISKEQFFIQSKEWLDNNYINFIINMEAISINRELKTITLENNSILNYNKLILSMGSHPFIPSFIGVQKTNIISLRTINDADFILNNCTKDSKIVIIGGGVLGLETAGALSSLNYNVSILEGHSYLLPRQLNKESAKILEKHSETKGIKIIKNAKTKEFLGDKIVSSILLEDNRIINADFVIITTGVRANTCLARSAKLEVHNGVVVNNKLETSDKNIFAVGDLAEHRGISYGTWSPAQFMGTIAGSNACGVENEFLGIPRSNMLKVLDFDMFSIGEFIPIDASYISFELINPKEYFYFLFKDNHLIGSILLGDTSISSDIKKAIEESLDFSEILQSTNTAIDILNFFKTRKN